MERQVRDPGIGLANKAGERILNDLPEEVVNREVALYALDLEAHLLADVQAHGRHLERGYDVCRGRLFVFKSTLEYTIGMWAFDLETARRIAHDVEDRRSIAGLLSVAHLWEGQ